MGTGTFGGKGDFFKAWGSTDVNEASRLVDICLDAGITMFDSADVYSDGVSEEVLGGAVSGRREQGADLHEDDLPLRHGAERRRLVALAPGDAVEASLRRLKTDHIDLYQLHGFDAKTPVEETMGTLDTLVRMGKVRYIGVSNFSGWHIMKSLAVSDRYGWARYVANQAYYSLLGRDYEWELLPLAWTRAWARWYGVRWGGRGYREDPPRPAHAGGEPALRARARMRRPCPTTCSGECWTPSTRLRGRRAKAYRRSPSTGSPCGPRCPR